MLPMQRAYHLRCIYSSVHIHSYTCIIQLQPCLPTFLVRLKMQRLGEVLWQVMQSRSFRLPAAPRSTVNHTDVKRQCIAQERTYRGSSKSYDLLISPRPRDSSNSEVLTKVESSTKVKVRSRKVEQRLECCCLILSRRSSKRRNLSDTSARFENKISDVLNSAKQALAEKCCLVVYANLVRLEAGLQCAHPQARRRRRP